MGNIHVHIVINSVRKLDAEPQEFMERPCDSRAGYKHHQTRDYLTAMQKGIMEIAQREGLHQVDLLNPAPVKITEREYWKTRREQEKLDELDSRIIADGMKPRTTTYQTQKQFLRDAITDAASLSLSLEQFRTVLSEKYGITLKESRGRFSYDYFLEHCETYGLTQSEMIRKALEGKIIRPVIHLCPVNERVLTALNALIAESQRIGNNLNQIARVLNAGEIMPRLAADLQMLHGELRDWKYRMLRQVGEILGNDQTYQL